MEQQNRQLAAILFTDIVGYTAMMQKDEQNALAVTRHFIAVLKQSAEAFHGRILNDYGDGSLCCFPSATEAVKAAAQIQQQLQQEPRVPLRIGIHVGELFFEENKVMGDSVNVASRIQSLACANSILFSKEVFDKLKNQPEYKSVSLGKFEFKNVDEPLEIFALATEGIIVPKREQLSGKLKEINKKSVRKKIILVAVVVFLLVAGFFFYKQFFSPSSLNSKEKSIAILPFKVIGNSPDALSQGLVEDILAHLMKIKELKVISNRSSVQFTDSKKSSKEIGEELDVNSLMTGSIQQIDNRIRVSAQLIDSKTGNLIWTDVYDRDKTQIFDLQTQLATQIVNALKTKLTPEEEKGLSKRYTENIDAYKLYRKGRWFWDKRSKESYDSAEANYQQAIQLDPDYALAYAGLADWYAINQRGIPQLEAIPIARDYANRALMLDSNLSEALTTKAFIQSHFEYDWKGAKIIFEKIIRENPNYAIAHIYYGNVLVVTGNTEAGINETKKALVLDPLSSVINMVLGRNYYYARNYDQAITQLQKTITLNPKFKSAYWHLGNAFLQKKLYPQAIDAYSKMLPGTFDLGLNGTLALSFGYSISGDKTKAKGEFGKISKEDYLRIDPEFLAEFYVSLGDFDEALTQLERGFDIHSIMMIALKVNAFLDPIRNEPRFKALMKKMNLE